MLLIHTQWREGVSGVIFACLGHMKVPFYRWTAPFYRMKLSRRVKKLLSFESWSSDIFSIEIYRRNFVKIWCFWFIFFYFLTLDAQKLVHMVESDKFQLHKVILLVKMQKFEKIWQKRSNFGHFSQKLDFLKICRYEFFL